MILAYTKILCSCRNENSTIRDLPEDLLYKCLRCGQSRTIKELADNWKSNQEEAEETK